MTQVREEDGPIIDLRNCECGAEPVYHSAEGWAHEIICAACGQQTDMEICGGDAVDEWNHGRVYRSAADAPNRRKYRRAENE